MTIAQILVIVVSTQVRLLRTEVEKVFVGIVLSYDLFGPKR